MFKGLCMLLLSEASNLLGSPETQKQVEGWAEEILSIAVVELPDGKVRTALAAALEALQAFEIKTPIPPSPPVDPTTLTDADVVAEFGGDKS